MRRRLLTIAMLAAAGSCGGEHSPAPLSPAAQRGEALFRAHCAACHSIEDGGNISAPALGGIVGRPAGSSGFAYSAAMRNSGIIWTREKLDRYLAAPREVVPDNEMAFFGMADPAMRSDLVEYLASTRATEP